MERKNRPFTHDAKVILSMAAAAATTLPRDWIMKSTVYMTKQEAGPHDLQATSLHVVVVVTHSKTKAFFTRHPHYYTDTHTHSQEFHPQVIRLAAVVVEAAAAGQYVLGSRCAREPFTWPTDQNVRHWQAHGNTFVLLPHMRRQSEFNVTLYI